MTGRLTDQINLYTRIFTKNISPLSRLAFERFILPPNCFRGTARLDGSYATYAYDISCFLYISILSKKYIFFFVLGKANK